MKTRQASKKEEEEKVARKKSRKLLKRRQTQFVRKDKVIRKNDLITDPTLGKIKLEAEETTIAAVKEEVEEPQGEESVVAVADINDMELLEGDMFRSAVVTGEPASFSAEAVLSSQSLVQVKIEIRSLSGTPDISIENPRTLLSQRDAGRDGSPPEKMNRLSECDTCSGLRPQLEMMKKLLEDKDKELSSETETTCCLRQQMSTMKELLGEKDKEIQRLEKVSRRNGGVERADAELQTEDDPPMTPHVVTKPADKILDLAASQHEGDSIFRHFGDVLMTLIKREEKSGLLKWTHQLPLLKTCRLVCKSWKDSVDQLLQNDPSHLTLRSDINLAFLGQFKKHHTPCPLTFSTQNFEDSTAGRRLREFLEPLLPLQAYLNPNYNPLPTRHLMMECDFDDRFYKWLDCSNLLTKYLQLFGNQVWFLTLEGRGWRDLREFAAFCDNLSVWLQLLPNLRSLTMVIHQSRHWRQNNLKGLAEIYAAFVSLQFKDLTTFQCFPDNGLSYAILKNNPHIRRLRSADNSLATPSVLEIEFHNLSTVTCNFHHVEGWNKFVSGTLRVQELNVGFDGVPLTMQNVMEDVGKFGSTLRSLTFNISQVGRSDPENIKLSLPQLICLHLKCEDWDPQPLGNLLSRLENLETFLLEFSVYDPIPRRDQPSERVRKYFLEYVNNFRSSTDWMRLAKLKSVKLTVEFKKRGAIGRQVFHVVRRANMPPVKFDIVKIDEKEFF